MHIFANLSTQLKNMMPESLKNTVSLSNICVEGRKRIL